MTAAYENIATTTLSSSTTSVNFNSISGSYTDLILVMNGKTASGGDSVFIRVNNDSGNNYSNIVLAGNGTSVYTGRRTNFNAFLSDTAYPQTSEGYMEIVNFMNYSNTTTYKTFLTRADKANLYLGATVGTWRSTSAITSINLTINSGLSFATGFTFTLYGIKAK